MTAAYNDAWAREREALALERDDEFEERYRAAADATGAIVDQLIAARPRTLAGVRAKAEALNWCHGERFEGLCGSSPGSAPLGCLWPPSTDQRLADAILFDLLALPNPIAV
ncbi:hypothetical protein [Methylocystis parvus]|uniref:hypothetical protein n=1 Tax=Methylocystis parvus TaxID=134 RepID=UPI003C7608EF